MDGRKKHVFRVPKRVYEETSTVDTSERTTNDIFFQLAELIDCSIFYSSSSLGF